MKFVPNATRRPSVSEIVSSEPTVGPNSRIDPADDRREDDLQRHRDARNRLGIEIHQVLPVDRAAERGQRGADERHAQLLAHDIDADRCCGVLVLRDSLERLAADAAVDPVPDHKPDQPEQRAR